MNDMFEIFVAFFDTSNSLKMPLKKETFHFLSVSQCSYLFVPLLKWLVVCVCEVFR